MFKAKQAKSFIHSDSHIVDGLYKNITKHNIVSLVDTRANSKDVERLKYTFQKFIHVFATSSQLSPLRAETALLIAKKVTHNIYNTYTYKQSNEDGNRALIVTYFDNILNSKVLLCNFYTPPERVQYLFHKYYHS